MMGLRAALTRHVRFYGALVAGALAWLAARKFGLDAAALAGGDLFYLAFLILCVPLLSQTPKDLKRRAKREDEGIVVVVLITLATMGFFAVAVFVALNQKNNFDVPALVLAGAGVPLGWCTLHTVMAFHYASLHYFDDPEVEGDERDLAFPGGGDPGVWDFLYFSFVVGMTAQVSDVGVTTTAMRRAVMLHGMLSFFFNTVLIAMAVNAAVAMAS
ncbi:MAG: DUF1345 domain-containing protein [Alphaproteobacteria bacterium]|nr:DUF1345 domain-containing protein [Alphaproteobacteria bacterium]